MTRPLIGITTHSRLDPIHKELDELNDDIARGIEHGGGVPVFIPHGLPDSALLALADKLDGLLLTGGGDVDPQRYNAALNPKTGGIDADRDRVEIALSRMAVADNTPVFGICRGAQVFNVALGGTLHQEVAEVSGAIKHSYGSDGEPNNLRPHPVQISEESRLAKIIGLPIVLVNSMHHQAVATPAPGATVVARAPDGIIEAIELPTHKFALAVQWHPESLIDSPEMQGLFTAFVQACK